MKFRTILCALCIALLASTVLAVGPTVNKGTKLPSLTTTFVPSTKQIVVPTSMFTTMAPDTLVVEPKNFEKLVGVAQSPDFIAVYGGDLTYDGGKPFLPGDTLFMYAPDGTLSGAGMFESWRPTDSIGKYQNKYAKLRFTAIYYSDWDQVVDSFGFPKIVYGVGIKRGDQITFKMNNRIPLVHQRGGTLMPVIWQAHGELVELFNFTSQCCSEKGRGDLNLDGSIDIGDLALMVDHLFVSYAPLVCQEAADLENDGDVSISDLNLLVERLFLESDPKDIPCTY